jgi:hypothetical protein
MKAQIAIAIAKCISLREELIKGQEQESQHIMWVYKIQEVKKT